MVKGKWRHAALVLAAVALVAAGCGDDDDDDATNGAETTGPGAAEAQALQDEIADLSDKEQVQRVAEAWVEPFAAADTAMCGYLHPDLGGAAEETCTSYTEGGLIGGAVPQAAFEGKTVERVEVKGQTAVAMFSHGQPVEFQQDPEGRWWVVNVRPPQ